MDKCTTGSCAMKRALENTDDPLAFFAEYHPIPRVLDELNSLSKQDLKCAVCLYSTALLKMSHKRSFWEKLKRKFTHRIH